MSNTSRSFRQYSVLIICLLSGAASTLAFAPFNQSWLIFFTLAIAMYCWNLLPAKRAAFSAWLFSMGLHCSGISWIYYSVHVHGSAPAAFAVLLVFLLCCYLSLYAAFAVYVVKRWLPHRADLQLVLFYPASWILSEWLQARIMTGFSWMEPGYTQIDWPLSGLAPLLGNHAVSGAIVATAGAMVMLYRKQVETGYRDKVLLLTAVLLLWTSAAGLKTVNWTEVNGGPVRVSVIQGNIAQQDKWKPQMKQPTMQLYRELSLAQQDVDLIVWPETAVPDYLHRVQPYIRKLADEMALRETDLLLGIFIRSEDQRVLNSVISLNGGTYHKIHLVPLGEYIPLRFLIEFFKQFVDIPMSDLSSGDADQPLLTVAGVPAGLSVCFEDAFSRDVIRSLPEAGLLINFSNDAWFEDSHQPHQHHAIARMRALEAGRYMIRSTNTGITAVIGPHGELVAQLPQFKTAVLNAEILPLGGSTPFVRWGHWLVVGLSLLVLLMCCRLPSGRTRYTTEKHR